ncbi:MAG: nucleotide exchange factor GrpE [Anaerohalosphaeraceae bacterium]|nr:nucleotide exchange factor GrpE [Anaerohalosphaeraceae bacterium]
MPNEFNKEVQNFELTEFDLEKCLDGILIDESIVSVELYEVRKICEYLRDRIDKFQLPEKQQELGKHIEIVANCQKQTAEFANAVLERHALDPAIKTVFALTNLIQDLSEQSANLLKEPNSCLLLKPMLDSISEAVKLANDKCEYLGIKKISPDELEDFNAQEHEIKQTMTIDDNNKHKKIHQTLIPGLAYRGKVLTPAKVSVYCFKN